MTLNQLRYFMTVARYKNLSRASADLGIAQPAISRQIKLLEEELGAPLLARHTRGVELTDVGTVLLRRAEFLLRTLDETRSEVLEFAASPSGSLRIGCPPALFRPILARPLRLFMSSYPNVRLEVRESISDELCREVLTDQLDLAIVTTRSPEPYLTFTPLYSEEIWLFGRKDARAAPASYSLQDVAKLPLLMARSSNPTRGIVERRAAAAGLRVNVLLETDSVQAISDLVAEGIGHAVAPYSGLLESFEAGLVHGAPVEDLRISRALVRRSDRPVSRAAQAFLSLLEAEVKLLVKSAPRLKHVRGSGKMTNGRGKARLRSPMSVDVAARKASHSARN